MKQTKHKKFRIEIEFVTEEDGGTKEEDIDSLLEGCWLYDDGFMGAITKKKIKKIK